MSIENSWLAQAKAVLDQSADGLDAATLSRLNRARQAALVQRAPPRRWRLPAGLATASVLVLAALIWQGYLPSVAPGAQEFPLTAKTAASSDIDLVSSDDSLEFYQDLEFYAWLDAQEQEQDLGS
jgi:hypothetical protein